MIIRLMIWLVLMIAPATAASAQGFAGLGTDADGFKKVVPGTQITFPADYGKHDGFRIEWWYITANLSAADGTQYGLQWTLFRQAAKAEPDKGAWSTSEFWMGHAAVTTPTQHLYGERLARGGTGQAGAQVAPKEVWIDNWQFTENEDGTLTLSAADKEFSYRLQLEVTGPEVKHGENGYSVKSDQGQASHYFSQPFYRATGEVKLADKAIQVTGEAWLDREWSSQPLASNQEGWDWFSIKFEDGNRLMAFGLRDSDGGRYVSGSWIANDGTSTPLTAQDIELRPVSSNTVSGREIPTRWRLSLPSRKIDLIVAALNPDSWMATSVPYWEGPVLVSGSHDAVGYLEMTGY